MESAFEIGLATVKADDTACKFRFPVDRDGTGGIEYDGVIGPSPDTLTLTAGGFIEEYAFTILARVADFAETPITGQMLLRTGKVARILQVEVTDLSPLILLHCGSPDK